MPNLTARTIWTLVLNCLILFGAGHGIGPLVLANIYLFAGEKELSFSLTASYDQSILTAALFSLPGQLLLLVSLMAKGDKSKYLLRLAGIVLLWIGYFYLVHHFFTNGLARFSFFTGLPFLISSVMLFYCLLKSSDRQPVQ